MKACYFSLVFIVILSSCSNSMINLGNVKIEHVCENQHLTLKCSKSSETLEIVRSMYGRTSQRLCNENKILSNFSRPCANIEQSKVQSKLRCEGKSSCQMLINNELFADPCASNIDKHFEIHYRCVDRSKLCSILMLNCSKAKDWKCLEKVRRENFCFCPPTICRLDKKENPIGFVESSCAEQILDEIRWKQIELNQMATVDCPKPCRGKLKRFCKENGQWSTVDSDDCFCPIEETFLPPSTEHRTARGYVFRCNSWLNEKIFPIGRFCLESFPRGRENSLDCLSELFQMISNRTCRNVTNFSIDFENLMFRISTDGSSLKSKIIVDGRVASNRWMFIEKKDDRRIIFSEQRDEKVSSFETTNVTIFFQHEKNDEKRFQCRAVRPKQFSLDVDASDMFFACRIQCVNRSQVICQCPFFNPSMNFVLTVDNELSLFDREIFLAENYFNGICDENPVDSIDELVEQISSKTRAKKIFNLLNLIVEKNSSFLHWTEIFEKIDRIGEKLDELTSRFSSINSNFEFLLQSNEFEFENDDRSAMISIVDERSKEKLFDFKTIFFSFEPKNFDSNFQSSIVKLDVLPKENFLRPNVENLRIHFRHKRIFDRRKERAVCVTLNAEKKFLHRSDVLSSNFQWTKNDCRLLFNNETDSICSCDVLSSFALIFEDITLEKSKFDVKESIFWSKLSCLLVMICVLLMGIVAFFNRSTDKKKTLVDDVSIVRKIFHVNFLFCLFVVEALFFFGIDQSTNRSACRIVGILLDFFLLASFSWLFVDGIELLLTIKHPIKIDRLRLFVYSLYSYGFPLLIVSLSISIFSDYSNENQFCWSSLNSGQIWPFAIPLILFGASNVVFLIFSNCRIDSANFFKFSLRINALLSMTFGLTWLFALISFFDSSRLFSYSFSILNSIDGFCLIGFYFFAERNRFETKYQTVTEPFRSSCSSKTSSNATNLNEKCLERSSIDDVASTSGYSSTQISEFVAKQISPRLLPIDSSYLPSVPVHPMTNYRYSTVASTKKILFAEEQHEKLLEKKIRHDEEHQYYEIR